MRKIIVLLVYALLTIYRLLIVLLGTPLARLDRKM